MANKTCPTLRLRQEIDARRLTKAHQRFIFGRFLSLPLPNRRIPLLFPRPRPEFVRLQGLQIAVFPPSSSPKSRGPRAPRSSVSRPSPGLAQVRLAGLGEATQDPVQRGRLSSGPTAESRRVSERSGGAVQRGSGFFGRRKGPAGWLPFWLCLCVCVCVIPSFIWLIGLVSQRKKLVLKKRRCISRKKKTARARRYLHAPALPSDLQLSGTSLVGSSDRATNQRPWHLANHLLSRSL